MTKNEAFGGIVGAAGGRMAQVPPGSLGDRLGREKLAQMLGKRGVMSFASQADADAWLAALPQPYSGRSSKSDSGKWQVRYYVEATHVPADRERNPPLHSPIVADTNEMLGMVGSKVTAIIQKATAQVREVETVCRVRGTDGGTSICGNQKPCPLHDDEARGVREATPTKAIPPSNDPGTIVGAAANHPCSQCKQPNYQWILGDPCMKCVRANHARAVGRSPNKSVPLRKVSEADVDKDFQSKLDAKLGESDLRWKAGDILIVRSHRSEPGHGLVYQAGAIVAFEDGVAGGWDVYDGASLDAPTLETSFYGFSVLRVRQGKAGPSGQRGSKTEAKPLSPKQLDREIERYWRQYGSGVQVNVMDIGKIFADVRAHVGAGGDVEGGVKDAINKYQLNKKEAVLKVDRSTLLKSKDSSPSADSECDEDFQKKIEKKLTEAKVVCPKCGSDNLRHRIYSPWHECKECQHHFSDANCSKHKHGGTLN